jgi:hypothetical protein
MRWRRMMENAGMNGSPTTLPKVRRHKWVFGMECEEEREEELAAAAGKWDWEGKRREGEK